MPNFMQAIGSSRLIASQISHIFSPLVLPKTSLCFPFLELGGYHNLKFGMRPLGQVPVGFMT
jgi:hypothetical protein